MRQFKPCHAYEGYRDFQCTIQDSPHDIGGYVQITLVDAPALEEGANPSAYGVICFDTPDGEEVLRSEFELSREQAERILGKELVDLPTAS